MCVEEGTEEKQLHSKVLIAIAETSIPSGSDKEPHASHNGGPVQLALSVDIPDGGKGSRHVAHLSSSVSKDDANGTEDLCSHARFTQHLP